MTSELLHGLLIANLALCVGIAAALGLRGPVRRRFGARLAYSLWLAPLLAILALVIPRPEGLFARAEPLRLAVDQVATALNAAVIAPAPALVPLPDLLVGFWLAGCAIAALFTALAHKRGMASFGGLSASSPRGALRAARGGLGPAMVGVWRPRLVLPADFETRFDPREQALILAHERHHDLCGDTRINGLVSLICCLNWFNPLVHLAAYLLRVDQELACDAAVVERFPGERRTYAQALLKSQLACVPLPLGCTWPGRSPNLLQERLTMLAFNTPGRRQLVAGGALVGALCLGAAATAWAASGSPAPQVVVKAAARPAAAVLKAVAVQSSAGAAAPTATPAVDEAAVAPTGYICLSNSCGAPQAAPAPKSAEIVVQGEPLSDLNISPSGGEVAEGEPHLISFHVAFKGSDGQLSTHTIDYVAQGRVYNKYESQPADVSEGTEVPGNSVIAP
jgi:beta-lactamase regulating signal transducer with metallopeptidase domain